MCYPMTNRKYKIQNRKSLVLGIDTGGTYTDGVLLDYDSRRVLAAYKSLTTKRDFSIGIESVIEGIKIEEPAAIKMVSISTTLATNAIAQGNGKRVALLLIGYDPELIASFKMEQRVRHIPLPLHCRRSRSVRAGKRAAGFGGPRSQS